MTSELEVARDPQILPQPEVTFAACDPSQSPHLQPVIVTLPRRPDRWKKLVGELARVGISGARKFSAVDGATLADDDLAALLHRDCVISDAPTSHTQLTRPAIGCFLSHLKIWQRFLEGDGDRLVVLEDDAIPAPQYSPAAIDQVLAALPADADLVLLGCTIMAGLAEPTENASLWRFTTSTAPMPTSLPRKGCAKLSQELLPLRAHIDHQISAALLKNRASLFAYAVRPPLFEHDFSSWSDAYVPIAGSEEADRQLTRLLNAARTVLRRDGRITRNED
ncbi:MAG TPA: glycosyltransferase family 25 protein [Hyphomicrobiaceae bacterium]|jgi:GR25 family glycosyltransferase involved in LPS biosynthesis|nr:glycosyltransferase family 25 protein [Hyphomicrobiaceae bacterium]